MQAFFLISTGPAVQLLARTIHAAIGLPIARVAPLGSEVQTADGVTLATRERICLDGEWLHVWLPTDEWDDDDVDRPVDLKTLRAALQELDEADHPILQLLSGDGAARSAPRGRLRLARAKPLERRPTMMPTGLHSVPAQATELEIESYRELEFAPDVSIDRDVVALRDPESGALFVAPRALFAPESSGVLETAANAVVNG